MEMRLVGAELFLAYGRTDITKLVFAFRNFAKAPNKMDGTLKYCRPRPIFCGLRVKGVGFNTYNH